MPPGRKSNASIAAQNAVQPPYPVLEQPIQPDSAEIAHLTILAADVIDALPPSVTRSLSDLKELDAVLNASILSIHEKLDKLHAMMMAPPEAYTPQQRLELLKEVAEDANAFKLGGEDKIRVATGACETIVQHTSQLDLITSLLTSLMPPHLLENLPASSTPAGYPHLFPPYMTTSHASPRKQDFFPPPHAPSKIAKDNYANALAAVQTYQRESPNLPAPRPATRLPKTQHVPNIPERTVSKKRTSTATVDKDTGSVPPSPVVPAPASSRSRTTSNRPAAPTASTSAGAADTYKDDVSPPKRSRKPPANLMTEDDKLDLESAASTTSSKDKHDDSAAAPHTIPDREINASPAPSMTSQRGNNGGGGGRRKKEEKEPSASPIVAGGKKKTVPAMVSKRAAPKRKTSMMDDDDAEYGSGGGGVASAANGKEDEQKDVEDLGEEVVHETVEGGGNEDPNEPKYCYCQRVSFGEMIACDNEHCKNEWFHLGCLGVAAVPKGAWFCDDCQVNMQPAPNKRRKVR